MPDRRITLKDIAREANLSVAAVSMALRNKPSLPETIKRVKKLSIKLGYIPDPALSALAARRVHQAPYKSVIALISDWNTQDGWLKSDGAAEIYEATEQRATELGYDLQHIWAREHDMSEDRLSDVLIARGIRGIILAACQTSVAKPLNLKWDQFSAVSIENPTVYPHIPNVTQDQYAAPSICWKRLLELGYARVGMVVPVDLSDRWGNRWDAAQALNQTRYETPENYVPTLRLKGDHEIDEIRTWIRTYRPDAVISRVPYFREAVEAEGLQIPTNIGYVSLNISDDREPHAAGILQHRNEMGISAADTLNSLLQNYQKGLNPISRCTQIVGSWHEGNTLIPANALTRNTHLAEFAS